MATGATVTVAPTVNTTYSVTAYTNCGQTSASATVNVTSAASLTVSPSSPAAICSGQQITLTASSNVSNATYAWYISTNLGTILSTSAALTVAPTANTTYRVVQTTSCGSSQQDVTVPVSNNAAPSISVTPNNPSITYGNSTNLTASGASSYNWSPSTGLNSTTGATVTATPTVTTTYTVTGFSTGGCYNTAQVTVTVNRPLPVKLVSFEASWVGGNALLNWATASEINSDYYAIERSLNGEDFTAIGQVAAQGTKATATPYSFHDLSATPKGTTRYYRLRQVDIDGKAYYSPVRTLVGAGTMATSLSLYPNPSGTRTTLVGAVAGANVQVLDALGRVVHTEIADASGTAKLVLPANTPKGLYLVRIGSQTIRLTLAE
ncbi:hypothetical protein GCM10023172_25830 [Hymenobacter ginsengisoli]|uniref:Ig-like domain-containing protein n=1 Tax=Hymenobacter ginsengisoli TaxID=1051626 RepID=A0ABP8QH69_9BACT